MIALLEPEKETDGRTMTDDEKWHAAAGKDPKSDGKFYYAVKTTGVYCVPSCSARPALRENVVFYDTPEDAEKAGFRPCKRCWPKGPSKTAAHETAVAKACRLIETAEEAPTLDELAKEAGMSNYYFHRVFKALIVVTPKEYATAHRTRRVRQELVKSNSVTEAIYGACFNSSGRFYAKSMETLGMTPTRFRKGGAGTRIRFAVRSWLPCQKRAFALFRWAMIRSRWSGICKINSQGLNWSEGTKNSKSKSLT
jgi:AraC family transcriptional regulator of adaptative response/methylated-DNA-[protein]-cysteine methyltransferase